VKGTITKQGFMDLLKDGMTIMVGGFLANGSPERLVDLVIESGVKNLIVICNDGGFEDRGVGKLIVNRKVRKLIASHIGTNPVVGTLMQDGEMEVELVPQGSLAEKIRAGGAGLGGILTPTGIETIVEKGKKIIKVQGVKYLLEEPLYADMALIGGAIVDKYGNLRYHQTMRNFNPIMAMASEVVVVEPFRREAVIDPEYVVTPHPLVDYVLEDE
jgi:acetate CoA/acetoacetate CoA-transferase alpha subunit